MEHRLAANMSKQLGPPRLNRSVSHYGYALLYSPQHKHLICSLTLSAIYKVRRWFYIGDIPTLDSGALQKTDSLEHPQSRAICSTGLEELLSMLRVALISASIT